MPRWARHSPERLVFWSTESGVYQVHVWDRTSGERRFYSPRGREWTVRLHECLDRNGEHQVVLRLTAEDILYRLERLPDPHDRRGVLVRLTGSGLGCPTWPKCDANSLTTHGELGLHGAIEFGNRLLTFVLTAVVAACLVAVWRQRPVRPGMRALAVAVFLGIPAQAVIGGITVLTGLNPWTVMGHLLLSMVLIGLATLKLR